MPFYVIKKGIDSLGFILLMLPIGLLFFLLLFFGQKNVLILILTNEGIINRSLPVIFWNEINDISFAGSLLKIYLKEEAIQRVSSRIIHSSKLYLFITKKFQKRPHLRLRLFFFSSDSMKKIQEIVNQNLEKKQNN